MTNDQIPMTNVQPGLRIGHWTLVLGHFLSGLPVRACRFRPGVALTVAATLLLTGRIPASWLSTFEGTERDSAGVRSYECTVEQSGADTRFNWPGIVTVWDLAEERVTEWRPEGRFYYVDDIPSYVLRDCYQLYQTEFSSLSMRYLPESDQPKHLEDPGTAEMLQGTLGLRLDLVQDNQMVLGRRTALLKIYGAGDLLLGYNRVTKTGDQYLSESRLREIVGKIRRVSDTATDVEFEAWRAYFRDGYAWLGMNVPSRRLDWKPLRLDEEQPIGRDRFEAPESRIRYDGRGVVSVISRGPWNVDGQECDSAGDGQLVQTSVALRCAGGNRTSALLLKATLRGSGAEVAGSPVKRTLEMLDGETVNVGFETTLDRTGDDTLDLLVALDGRVVDQKSLWLCAKH